MTPLPDRALARHGPRPPAFLSRVPHARRAIAREGSIVLRATVASLVATGVDGIAYQALLFISARIYPAAALAGAALGAVTNFVLNRRWAFPPTSRDVRLQVPLYAAASAIVYLGLQGMLAVLVEGMHMDARLAWVPAKAVSWATLSYPLFRLVVFAGARRPRA